VCDEKDMMSDQIIVHTRAFKRRKELASVKLNSPQTLTDQFGEFIRSVPSLHNGTNHHDTLNSKPHEDSPYPEHDSTQSHPTTTAHHSPPHGEQATRNTPHKAQWRYGHIPTYTCPSGGTAAQGPLFESGLGNVPTKCTFYFYPATF
jgi:hypothetical protein